MLGMMIGTIQGGIRMMASKQKVRNSNKSNRMFFPTTHTPLPHHSLSNKFASHPCWQLRDRKAHLLVQNRISSANVVQKAYKVHLARKFMQLVRERDKQRKTMRMEAMILTPGSSLSSRTSSSSHFIIVSAACTISRSWLTHHRRVCAGSRHFFFNFKT